MLFYKISKRDVDTIREETMKQTRKKRAITLIEIMIVLLLIGLIGGALAFNMRGSVDKGRLFKTEQNCTRVADALNFAYASGEITLHDITNMETVRSILARSPFIKDIEATLKDGWGNPLEIRVVEEEIVVASSKHTPSHAKNIP
jgi:type II secretory pathway pseudopilin PulG